MSEARKIPEIIIQGIKKSIEISKKCINENGKISPKVGAVLIKENHIIATAYRGEIEQGDHAEYTLIEKKLKGYSFENSILITTLEPCTIRSVSKKSCAERIVDVGIQEVWIGINDPNPEISGKGYTYLMEHNIRVNYFPDDYAHSVKELNEDFWNNEIDKYKHDLMSFPKSFDLSKGKIFSIEHIKEYTKSYIEIDKFISCLGEKLPLIKDYDLFNLSVEKSNEQEIVYNYPYNVIYKDYRGKPKFNLDEFLSGLNKLYQTIILVKGPSGIGKTLLLNYLRHKLSINFHKEESKIPVLIDLNYFSFNKSIQDLCKEQIQSKISISNDDFKFIMKEYDIIILFDAYNELKRESQVHFIKDLKYLMELYPKISVIVTMTPNTIFDIPVNNNDSITLWMNPIILDNLKDYYNSQNLSINFYEFINQLRVNSLLELVRIPLFFNYIIIFLKKNKKLPNSQYEVIEGLINYYLNEYLGKKFKTLDFKESEGILQQLIISLSYYMHVELENNKIETNSLKIFFSNELKASKRPNEVRVDDLINFLIEFNILKNQDENSMFFHNILFEYYCALKLAEEIEKNKKLFKKKKFFHKKMLEDPINIAFPLIKNKKFYDYCKRSNNIMYINGILQFEELQNEEIEYVKNLLLKMINSDFLYIRKLAVQLIPRFNKFLMEKEDFLIKILSKENIRKSHAELILELGRINSEKVKKYLLKLNGGPDIHGYRIISLCTFKDDSIQKIVLNELKEKWHGTEFIKWVTEGLLLLDKNDYLSDESKKEVLKLFLDPPKKLKFDFKDNTHYDDTFSISFSYRNGLKKFLIQMNDSKIVPSLIKSIDYDRIDSFPIIEVVSRICSESHFNDFLEIVKNDQFDYKKRDIFIQVINNSSYKISQSYILDLIEKIPSKLSDNKEDLFYRDLIELLLHKERIIDYNEDIIFKRLTEILDSVGISQKTIISIIGKINPSYLFENNPIKMINYYAFETLLEIIKDNRYADLKDWLIVHAKKCIPNWMKGANSAFHNWFLFFKILNVLLEIGYYDEVISLFSEILEKIDDWNNINNLSFQIINKFKDNDKMPFIKKIFEEYTLLPKDKTNYSPSLFLADINPFKSEEFLKFNLNILRLNSKSNCLIAENAIKNLINLDVIEFRDDVLDIFKKGTHVHLLTSFFKLLSTALPEKKCLKLLKPFLKDKDHFIRNAAFREIQLIYEKQNILWYNGEEK